MTTTRYLARRLGHAALLLVAVSMLSFLFSAAAPGDFFDAMKLNPQISPQTLAALRTQYGLDQPLPQRYLHWLASAARGDFGYSFAYNVPVSSLLGERLRNTLLLASVSTALAWMMALPLGLWSAQRRGRWPDRACETFSSFLLATPEFAFALLLLIFAVRSGVLPAGGMVSPAAANAGFWTRLADILRHLVVPAMALALAAVPVIERHVQAAVAEVLDTPFVDAAQANGLSRKRILFRHALPAAANPLLSLFGLSLGSLISGSLLVEVITGWPGLGPLFLESVFARDFYVVAGVVIASATFLILGNLVADLLIGSVDPRIRMEGTRA
jgi:peptide/nickel transport system permease protein